MIRTDPAYWQRLRRDKRSNFAAGLTLLAWLAPIVGIAILVAPGTQGQARGNPLYWLVLLPSAWWATSLTRFEPGAVRFIKLAQVVAPVVAAGTAVTATRVGEDATPFWIATAASIMASAAGWLCYRGSLLEREGPAR